MPSGPDLTRRQGVSSSHTVQPPRNCNRIRQHLHAPPRRTGKTAWGLAARHAHTSPTYGTRRPPPPTTKQIHQLETQYLEMANPQGNALRGERQRETETERRQRAAAPLPRPSVWTSSGPTGVGIPPSDMLTRADTNTNAVVHVMPPTPAAPARTCRPSHAAVAATQARRNSALPNLPHHLLPAPHPPTPASPRHTAPPPPPRLRGPAQLHVCGRGCGEEGRHLQRRGPHLQWQQHHWARRGRRLRAGRRMRGAGVRRQQRRGEKGDGIGDGEGCGGRAGPGCL